MRYYVEQAVATSPDDFEWQPDELDGDSDDLNEAIKMAKAKVRPTEYGPSGVRVYDSEEQKVAWEN